MVHSHFKNHNSVVKSIPDIFVSKCENKLNKLEFEESTEYPWFALTPRFTTFRVNSLKTTVDEVAGAIKKQLDEEAELRGIARPEVAVHSRLNDCLVIGCWHDGTPLLVAIGDGLEVIVDAACGAAVLRGAHVFAPGVMAMPPSVYVGSEVGVYADTSGKCRRGMRKVYVDGRKVFVGSGIVRMDRHRLFDNSAHPRGVAVEMVHRASGVATFACPAASGLLQNLPSVVSGHVLHPRPGQLVLDMCAAPGNKTTHLAALMANQGTIVALDKTESKISRIRERCDQLSITNVQCYAWDATRALKDSPVEGGCCLGVEPSDLLAPPFAPATFDRILLDAPCSALGQRPQLTNAITERQLRSYPPLQQRLFLQAVALLKPGGVLVYSTCTITVAENEGLVAWALKKFPSLHLVPAEPILGLPGLAEAGLSEVERICVQRFGPPILANPDSDTVGFFIAKFVRRSDLQACC